MNAMGKMDDGHLDGDLICGLAEGGLEPAVLAAAEAHVQGCGACRREVEVARGYFRELSGLEPEKAPPNFLSNVRARLPRPSPWKALLDGLLRPFRAIPLQVALLTVIGLTAVSSYLYQRGTVDERPTQVIQSEPVSPKSMAENQAYSPSLAAAAQEARENAKDDRSITDARETPAKRPMLRMKQEEAYASQPAAGGDAYARSEAAAKSSAPKPAVAMPQEERTAPPAPKVAADRDMLQAAPRQSPAAPALSVPAPSAAPAVPSAPAAAEKKVAKAPAPEAPRKNAAPSAQAAGRKSVETSGYLDEGVASLSSPVREEVEADAMDKESLKPGRSDRRVSEASRKGSVGSAYGSASGAVAAAGAVKEAEMSEEAESRPAAKAKAAEPAPPAFTLHLKGGKSAADVVAGLKAMGIEAVVENRDTDGLSSLDDAAGGRSYRVPPSMLKEIGPYLERYGRVERDGGLPGSAAAPVRILLRILPPGK
jgi:hypothetical protein